ncbi:MAG: hypothetical protein NWQ38_00675 [Cellulophaga sp.]|nr:hypothetical protein [Cellulophaga sp.]
MKVKLLHTISLFLMMSSLGVKSQIGSLATPIMERKNTFLEKEGLVSVEAEYFYKQTMTDKRQWFRTSTTGLPDTKNQYLNKQWLNASNGSYVEVLPDTRVTHADPLNPGENFSNDAGKVAVLHYRVRIDSPGRYYVWVRAFSSGSEDNGIHVGLNGEWPESGQRMQWCEGKNKWTWESKQRTKEVHCGVPQQIYLDIEKSGVHDIQFSMREDGFEFDKFILSNDINYVPENEGAEVATMWPIHSYFKMITASNMANKTIPVDDFLITGTGFYKDADGKWFAVNPNELKKATSTTNFNFTSGHYDMIFVAVGEHDGQSEFEIKLNNKKIGTYKPTLTNEIFEEGPNANGLWENIKLNQGDKIEVTANIASADGKEWARGRWSGIVFAPVGQGKKVQQTPFVKPNLAEEYTTPMVKAPLGRIAIVADGNSPDPDDLGGTAVSIALLRASGLENRLVHYSHSCDLVRVDRISEAAENERHALMQAACDVTARRWGGFEGLTFFDAKWQQNETVNDLKNAINASSAEDPLWIIEAGEPDIIGYALEASSKNKHQFVKVITHHPANDDAGDFYTWQQILDFGVEEVRIPDQNINLKVDLAAWDWAKEHTDPRIQWVWIQGKIAELDDVVRFQKGKWDCSDAGMVLYWITGAKDGGLSSGTVADVKYFLLDYIQKN